MEKLKPSEEEIIKLGKKIVNELQLEPSVNTLGRWMSHYVAELILQVENSNSDAERETRQKECFDTILELWKNRQHLPDISTPLGGLKPFIDLLNKLNEDEHPFSFFRELIEMRDEGSWTALINSLKMSSENIIRICLLSQVSTELLHKKQEWLVEFKSMLNKEEQEVLISLENFLNHSKSIIITSNRPTDKTIFDNITPQDRYKAIFNRIEEELSLITLSLNRLKESIQFNDD
ncbi:MAG: hypothetical protein IPN76_26915 [Saprospiraceae bacterium]|nr:hypothetical protein [Saprospiraceae bacterium]